MCSAGWDEIIRLKEKLGSHLDFSTSRYQVLPLHSMVPAADQRKIFVRPPPGVRKVRCPSDSPDRMPHTNIPASAVEPGGTFHLQSYSC